MEGGKKVYELWRKAAKIVAGESYGEVTGHESCVELSPNTSAAT
jgi:hypothetical protein